MKLLFIVCITLFYSTVLAKEKVQFEAPKISVAKATDDGVSLEFKDALAMIDENGKEIKIYLFTEKISSELKEEIRGHFRVFFLRGQLPKLKDYKHPSYIQMSFSVSDVEKLSKAKVQSFHGALCGFAKEESRIMNLNNDKNDNSIKKIIKKFDYKNESLDLDMSFGNGKYLKVKLKTKVYSKN